MLKFKKLRKFLKFKKHLRKYYKIILDNLIKFEKFKKNLRNLKQIWENFYENLKDFQIYLWTCRTLLINNNVTVFWQIIEVWYLFKDLNII